MTAIVLLVLTLTTQPAPPNAACTAPDAVVRLDHAIVVVRDLDAAAGRFAPLGFRFKPGRLHPDGLLNRHIKFRDRTELELMTVQGAPRSGMARDYATLLAAGEGGVYAALWTHDAARVRRSMSRLGEPRVTPAGPVQFMSLPGVRDTHAVFFGTGDLTVTDPDEVLAHDNGASGLTAAWIEAGPAMRELLEALGSRTCGEVKLPNGLVGQRWALARGSLVIVEGRDTRRVLGVELRRASPGPEQLWEPLSGFWVRLR